MGDESNYRRSTVDAVTRMKGFIVFCLTQFMIEKSVAMVTDGPH